MNKAKNHAAFLIAYSVKQGCPISNLKLQKLLYLAQAYALISKNRKLFEELIEAWAFGPVVPSVYKLYKQYGCGSLFKADEDAEAVDSEDQRLLTAVFGQFKDWSATDLTRLTLNQRPWQDAYTEDNKTEITVSAIKSFFSKEE